MGVLKLKDQIPRTTIDGIATAADNAYSDDILFEEFERWTKNYDDDSFLYLINHYWETIKKPVLSHEESDFTGQAERVEVIKEKSKQEVAQKFAQFLNKIVLQRKLTTLEAIGEFLELSPQRVSVLLKGDHKPQRATIAKIAEKFEIPLEKIQKEIPS